MKTISVRTTDENNVWPNIYILEAQKVYADTERPYKLTIQTVYK